MGGTLRDDLFVKAEQAQSCTRGWGHVSCSAVGAADGRLWSQWWLDFTGDWKFLDCQPMPLLKALQILGRHGSVHQLRLVWTLLCARDEADP